jgi:hypothetical protein
MQEKMQKEEKMKQFYKWGHIGRNHCPKK